METIEIQRKELNGAKPLCYGYKAVKWDSGTNQRFRYGETGEKLEGKIFRVDGDINACSIFNKKSNKSRVKEVLCKIREFNWIPEFSNWYGIKGNQEWWAFCFPQLQYVDNDIAWSKMPQNMLDYIKELPEFSEAVWKELTKK